MHTMHTMRCLLAALTLALLAPSLQAEIRFPSVIGDNMVLQRGEPVPVWGWDTAGTKVSVTIGVTTVTATAGADGRWTAYLPTMKAGGPHEITVKGTSEATIKNVLVGEVWFCSGQSNMEWRVKQSNNADEEIAAAKHPRIRHIKFPHRPADNPQSDIPSDGWKVCSPETVGDFTAVGYFYGRFLQKELDVPIGLLGCNWGGTRIEPWIPPAGFRAVPKLADIAGTLDQFPTIRNNGAINHQTPMALYNGMVAPVIPYGIRGAIWYQGESNNGEGMLYYEKMKALIAGWRATWQKPNLPFYYVQLAPYNYRNRPPEMLAGIWEAQLKTLSVPHTGMAVTVDIGNRGDIHPKNKQDVGKRLGLWALAKTYGKKDLVYSGPLYKSMKVQCDSICISFNHVGDGLVSRDDKPLSHFTIAGEDKTFVEATATIKGKTVVIRADTVKKPVAVRFGWHQEAEPNLSNKNGLPASPFRTDSW
jgi:sialate O-acetylesterase